MDNHDIGGERKKIISTVVDILYFLVLKGILGFLIGIVSGLAIEYCAWKFGWGS